MTLTEVAHRQRALEGRKATQDRREAKMRQLIVGFEYDPGEDWKRRSGCKKADPDLFELLDGEQGMDSRAIEAENVKRNQKARLFCERKCPVVAQCLAYALTHEMQGTWAGELITMADIYAARRVRKQMWEAKQ
jgi:hypothetical protein